MLENTEVNQILEKLENLEDEQLAVKLLADFNAKTAKLGKLLRNRDPKISHEDWKKACDEAQKGINEIVSQIKNA